MAQPPLAYAEGYAKARLWDQLQADNYIKHTAIGDAVLDPVMEELSSLPPADLHRFILIWFLKSLRLGLVSLVPNFIPAAMSFGLWGYLVGQVDLAGSVMTAIAFGLIVDDPTHFLSKYQKARREGLLAPEAVRSTFRTVGQALWTTTVVLAAGFLVYSASGFEVSWALGLMVTITIVFAIAADFLLLPPLLMAIDRRKS